MIERIRFATRRAEVDDARFEAGLRALAASALAAASDVAPVRATVSVVVPDLLAEPPRHHGVVALSFADEAHLRRFEARSAADGAEAEARFAACAEVGASPMIVVEPIVVRGEGWLDRRWSEGGPALKHLALAVRAAGLSPAQFSQRWRDHAGGARTAVAPEPLRIPDVARGQAYVQDHPRSGGDGTGAYDAVSEVWFDSIDDLRHRIDWFTSNRVGRQGDDLFQQSWFLAVREEVIPA